MNEATIQTVLLISTTLLGLYLSFFKSYFTEKGKNVATEEDIGKITKIVEDVKKEFATETEYLKNRLSLYAQNFHSIKTLERNALIELNLKYSEWLHSMSIFSLVFYSYENFELLKEQNLIMSKKYMEFEVANDNLKLYVINEQLLDCILLLSQETRELQGSLMKNICLFIANCELYNAARNIKPEMEIELNSEYHAKQNPIIDSSLKDMVEINKKINPHHITFIKILGARIHELIDAK